MSLREYQRKRDFQKTPEPAGKAKSSASARQFVIQKHVASHLHYDFRLELDGVLKSWAVPKGPSLDPHKKSLAVQVEDHPIDYAGFEGTIPQGQYGGGTVMVWDNGTWEPDGDPAKSLQKGRLNFSLEGEKLHGEWSLVRMAGRAGENGKNWLLIKRTDDAARDESEFRVQDEDRSVLSGRSMDQIARAADAVWQPKARGNGRAKSAAKPKTKRTSSQGKAELPKLSGVQRATLPADFTPHLATLVDKIPKGDDWLHELKFDGYRILAFIRAGRVQLKTRTGQDWTQRFSDVAEALKQLPLREALIDGEIVALDEHGGTSFQSLQRAMEEGRGSSLVYYAFDIPFAEGNSLLRTPLIERKELLSRIVLANNSDNTGTVRYSDFVRGQGEDVLKQACEAGAEGIVSKQADSVYEQRRTRTWVKTKCLQRQEFVIGGFTKPGGARTGFGALLLGYFEPAITNPKRQRGTSPSQSLADASGYHSDRFIYCGKVGTGFSQATLRQLHSRMKQHQVDSCSFDEPPPPADRRGVTWVEPVLVAEIEFLEWTDDGYLRHPSFQGLREDKPARDIGRERAAHVESKPAKSTPHRKQPAMNVKATAAPKAAKARPANDDASDAVVAGVTLSHPGRLVYPEQGVTKLELARYYEAVAEHILPHVAGRPLTLVRCPQGRQSKCFYQKHVTDAMPDAIHGVPIREKNETTQYVSIDDVEGLISLVQMGILEIHPWGAKADDPEKADRLVFDLDPGEGVDWQTVVDAAVEVRDFLADLGLESFARTTGGKGLHVVVPIARKHDWDTIKRFSQSVALAMEKSHPERYVTNMAKAKRRGKIFLDYLRNQRGATAVASFSTRARPGAPVATPIRWNELSADVTADAFNVRNLPQRLSRMKKDPWEGFFTLKQNVTATMLMRVSSP